MFPSEQNNFGAPKVSHLSNFTSLSKEKCLLRNLIFPWTVMAATTLPLLCSRTHLERQVLIKPQGMMAIKILDLGWRIVNCASQPGVQDWVAVLGDNNTYSNVPRRKWQNKEFLPDKSAQQPSQLLIHFTHSVCSEDHFHRKCVFRVCSLTFPVSSSSSRQNQPKYSSWHCPCLQRQGLSILNLLASGNASRKNQAG